MKAAKNFYQVCTFTINHNINFTSMMMIYKISKKENHLILLIRAIRLIHTTHTSHIHEHYHISYAYLYAIHCWLWGWGQPSSQAISGDAHIFFCIHSFILFCVCSSAFRVPMCIQRCSYIVYLPPQARYKVNNFNSSRQLKSTHVEYARWSHNMRH